MEIKDKNNVFLLDHPVACTRTHTYVCRSSVPVTYLMRVVGDSPYGLIVSTPHGLTFIAQTEDLRELTDEELDALREYETQATTAKKILYGGPGAQMTLNLSMSRANERPIFTC